MGNLDSYDIKEFLTAFDQAVASVDDYEQIVIMHHFWTMERAPEWIAKNITTLGMNENQVKKKIKEHLAYVRVKLIKKFGEDAYMDYVNNWEVVLRFL